MEILLIALSQVSVAASVALALHDTCKEISNYQNFCLHFGKMQLSVGEDLPWPVLRRCLRYVAIIQPKDIDNLSLRDVANLLISFNYLSEAERLCPSQPNDQLFNGFMSNGSVDLLNRVTGPDMYFQTYKKRLLSEMRIPLQSTGQLDYFDMWGCWLRRSPVSHIYKFLARTMRARSVVALEWCLNKLSQKMSRKKWGCTKRHYTWLDNIMNCQKHWPKRITTIKTYADAWGHPKAVEFAKRFE